MGQGDIKVQVSQVVRVALVKARKKVVQPVCFSFIKMSTICQSLNSSSLMT